MFFNPVSGVGVTFLSRFCAYRDVAQSIPVGSYTKIEFNAEYYDNNAEYEHGANFQWTCKIEGDYHIGSVVLINSLGNEESINLVIISSVNSVIMGDARKMGVAGIGDINASGDYHAVVDETLHVEVYHNKDAGKNTGTGGRCLFYGHRIG